jgi:RNA polymerase sigma-70 factor (ECF subfamily)
VANTAFLDDRILTSQVQYGNHTLFEEVVRQHGAMVLRLALRLIASESDAQDIYQETFLRVHRGLANFRCECSFSTWIYRIVTNVSRDYLRKTRRLSEGPVVAVNLDGEEHYLLEDIPDDRSASPERQVMSSEIRLCIMLALKKLTPRERRVFEMKHYQGLGLRAIGEIFGSSEESIKATLFRATRKMRDRLAGLR